MSFCAILKSNRNRKHFSSGYPNKILICSTNETYFEFQFPTTNFGHWNRPAKRIRAMVMKGPYWMEMENAKKRTRKNALTGRNSFYLNRQSNHSIYVCDLVGINVIYFLWIVAACRLLWCTLARIQFRWSGWEVDPFDMNCSLKVRETQKKSGRKTIELSKPSQYNSSFT